MKYFFVKRLFLLTVVLLACNSGCNDSNSINPVDVAMSHIAYLAESIGPRPAGSEEEFLARDYINEEFKSMGFSTEIQKFTYGDGDNAGISYNVIALLQGASPQEIIIGAHYDSVEIGQGATDNASGVALMLVLMQQLKNENLPYTLRFIAFGAEEVGLRGSGAYAGSMSTDEINNTLGMVNLDTVAGGDKIYVYGNEDQGGWMRNQCLAISDALGLGIETNPGLNPDYPMGTTGDWSDHAYFKHLGIAYLCLESTNWEIGDLDGYTQTQAFGEIWHTENDTLAFYDIEFPGLIESQLDSFITLMKEFCLTAKPPANQINGVKAYPSAARLGSKININRHSGIKFVTPSNRHKGIDKTILENREKVYQEARKRTPERWSCNIRNWDMITEVTLNPEHKKTIDKEWQHSVAKAEVCRGKINTVQTTTLLTTTDIHKLVVSSF